MHKIALMALSALAFSSAAALAQQDITDMSDTGARDTSSSSTQAPQIVTIAPTPPTKIEAVEQTPGVVITKRFTKGAAIASDDGGTINLYAAVVTTGDDPATTAVAVELVGRAGRIARVYIDSDEIDRLISGLSTLEKVDRPSGSLDGVEARYITRGHLVFINVDDGGSRSVVIHALQVAPVTGQVATATLRIRAGRLAEIRQQISAARDLLARESK